MKKISTEFKVEHQVPLAALTTMKVGGPARYFFKASTTVELVEAVQWAVGRNIPYFVLGGGSNVIIADSGFNGLVIQNATSEVLLDSSYSVLQVDCGVKSGRAASAAASSGLSGLEFFFGIPGTVGGAVYGNAGVRGHETKDVLKDVVLLTVKEGNKSVVARKKKDWLRYEYRSSILKREKTADQSFPPVLLSVRFQLYPARREVIMERMKSFIEQRSNQPYGLATAGCIFRNPSTDPDKAAGRLLDLAGAKRLRSGGAAVAKQHANFIYNRKGATAGDLKRLIDKCHDLVQQSYKINLQREVELVGDFEQTGTKTAT